MMDGNIKKIYWYVFVYGFTKVRIIEKNNDGSVVVRCAPPDYYYWYDVLLEPK
jgi:hypothetical protein